MIFWLFALGTLIVDQLTKYIVRINMRELESIPLIREVFHLTYILNPGAAFGMLAYKTVFFIVMAIVVIGGVIIYNHRLSGEQLVLRIALGLQVGGAIGNLIDRVRFAHVVDFLDFRVFPVFNFADTAITVGVGLLILEILRQNKLNQADNTGGN
ncbi:MAG: signal peptidase II [Carboxydocellales bacterium]